MPVSTQTLGPVAPWIRWAVGLPIVNWWPKGKCWSGPMSQGEGTKRSGLRGHDHVWRMQPQRFLWVVNAKKQCLVDFILEQCDIVRKHLILISGNIEPFKFPASVVLCSPFVWKPSFDYFIPSDSPNRMFPLHPQSSVLSGTLPAAKDQEMALMVGRTKDEGLLNTAGLINNADKWAMLR